MYSIEAHSMLTEFLLHVLAGHEDGAPPLQSGIKLRLLPDQRPHSTRVQTATAARVVEEKACRAEAPCAWRGLRESVTFSAADTSPVVIVGVQHCRIAV